MISSFIFIKTKAGFLEKIIDSLKQMEEIKELWAVTGSIDIIVLMEGKDMAAISTMVLTQIQKIDGIERTATHIVMSI